MFSYSIRQDIYDRKVAFIVTILLIILGIELGLWQLRRAEYKENLATSIAAKENAYPISASEKKWELDKVRYHQMIATGTWINEGAIWIDNRPHPQGRDKKTGITTGFFLIMPMKIRINQQEAILWVNRGWAPRSFTQRDLVPEVPTNNETVTIRGIVIPDVGKTLQIGVDESAIASDGHALKQNFSLENASSKFNLPYQPFILRQIGNEVSDGLDRNWQSEDFGASKHLGYAFQWFALALMTFLFWVITGIRKQRKRLG